MTRSTLSASVALLLAMLMLRSLALAAEPQEGDDWSGWRNQSETNVEAAVEDGGVSAMGEPDPAYSPSDLVEALAAPPTEPGQNLINLGLGQEPAPNDLISETARGLDCNWAQCYLFVRNHIVFTPYRGISRGPERTLLDREGSDGDQAFLLLALLRASGYTNTTTVMYAPPPTDSFTGGFAMPLGGTTSGYDAASWLGVPATGTVSAIWNDLVGKTLVRASLDGSRCGGSGGPAGYTVRVQHFWVRLTLGGTDYYLDPSFKPRRVTAPSASLLTDMGYIRSNLLAKAGGTVTNDWYVSGLATTNLTAELSRLSTNLAANWRASGTNVPASYFIGGDTIVPQNLAADTLTFHGATNGVVVDFLAQTDTYKNALRTSVTLKHGGLTNTFWLDELGARHLWVSYTNSAQTYPKAVLHLDDAVVTNEPAGSSQSAVTAIITVSNYSSVFPAQYSLTRSNGNVYAIPIGFGGDHNGGMRERAENELGRLRAAGLSETNVSLRSRVLQVVGQQWLAQTALLNTLDSRLKASGQHCFYNIGIAGQAESPYVDLKNNFSYSIADPSKFDGYMLFSSALEHGVLDQLNGTNKPAVSTVRVIALANATNLPIYFASSANWTTIRNALTNYSAGTLSGFDTDIGNGRKILLPRNGSVALNRWSGCGYINYGPAGGGYYSSGMIIGGGLSGGFTSEFGSIPSIDGYNEYEYRILSDASFSTPRSSDPVDMQAGASLITRTDLAMTGPAPLAWSRHYDSRARWADGPLGRGWTHGYDAKASVHADPDAFLGRGAPEACAPSVVASAVVADLLAAGESAKNLATACLVVKWWTDQLVDGAVTVKTGNEALSFTRTPDGAYVSSPGVTANLSRGTNGQFTLQERLGRTWTFATNGTLTGIVDPSGNSTALSYSNATCLVTVSNSFGRKFTLNWSGNRVSSVTDSAGRSVAYRYSPSGCLTGVTDAANYAWSMTYDTNAAFVSETDPTGVTNVFNTYNALGQVTNQVAANGSRWPFGFAAGIRAWESDPFTNRTVYTYSEDGRLAQRVDRDGSTNTFFYDGQGQMVSNVDAVGRITLRQYDASNRLVRLTEAANTANARATDFVYDNQHRLVAVTNALGRTTRMTYDASHRLTSRTAPDGTITTNVYDSHGLPTSTRVLDAIGQTLTLSSFGYDSRGFATTVSSTDAGTNQFAYDNAGNVTNAVDALGHATRFAYDPRGFATNTVDALTGRTVRAYTSAGRLSTVVDPLLHTNTFLWSASGHPAGVRFPDGGQTTNEYDIADRLVASKDPRGNRVAVELDAMGRPTRRSTPNWQEQTWFDIAGCATSHLDAVNGRTDTGFDAFNRPVWIKDPLSRTWTNAFDALDTLTATVDPRHRTTSYNLDAMERRTRVSYPSGRIESFGLDAFGRLVAFTNSEGHAYRLAYDGQGRVVAATNAAGEQVFRNYFDACGNLTNRLDGAGRATRNQFDGLNRCTNTVYSDGSSESFTFDAAGNLLSARNAATTNTFTYDSMNRLASSVSRVGSVAFTNQYRYDQGGLATNLVYPDGKTVRYTFDADGRVTNVVDWAGHTWNMTRDAAGRLTALSYPNGVAGAWSHDAAHAVSSWSYSGAAGLPGRTITRDTMGLKTREDVTSGPMPVPGTDRRATNTFNAADRLTSAVVTVGTNTFTETYLSDPCGALTNLVRGAGASSDVFSYDLAGRMTAASASNLSLAATFDALGNRVKTAVNGTNRLWVIDHADPLKRPLMETTTNGTPVRYFVWGAGRLLAAIDADGTTRYAHSDDHGSVVALTSTNGAVLFTANYGPYGEPWGTTGTNVTPFGWLGGHGVFHAGNSSLYLTRHRAYDTTLKRFLSQDPLGLGGGANLYAYALGNPLSYIDPLGLCAGDVPNTVGLVGSAGVLEQAAQVRFNYNAWVAQYVTDSGGYEPARDAIRAYWNAPANSTTLSRGVAEMWRWEQELNGVQRNMASPTATALAVNNAAAIARYGGQGLIVLGAGMSLYNVATAPDPYRATVQNGAAITVGAGGATAGAWAGGAIGSAFPGPGTAIGAVVGGIIGGIGGSVGGNALGGAAYDANYGPNSPWFRASP